MSYITPSTPCSRRRTRSSASVRCREPSTARYRCAGGRCSLGAEKPDRRIFLHALEALGIPPEEWRQVVMVGNNLARDIRGANRLGLISVWLAWNARYPLEPASGEEVPRYQVTDAGELSTLLTLLDQGGTPPAFAYPRPDAAMPRG